jgi:hypothetical protein
METNSTNQPPPADDLEQTPPRTPRFHLPWFQFEPPALPTPGLTPTIGVFTQPGYFGTPLPSWPSRWKNHLQLPLSGDISQGLPDPGFTKCSGVVTQPGPSSFQTSMSSSSQLNGSFNGSGSESPCNHGSANVPGTNQQLCQATVRMYQTLSAHPTDLAMVVPPMS